MSELSRAKKSCEPCRRRKSRCNDQIVSIVFTAGFILLTACQPCQSCILRRTEAKCIAGSAQPSTRTRPAPYVLPSPARSSPRQSMSEIDELRASISALQQKVGSLSNGDATSAVDGNASDSAEERENWAKLSAVMPPLEAVEILLEFLHQECDWLYWRSNLIQQWTRALSRRAVSTANAGSMCIGLAVSSLLLGPNGHMLYHPTIHTTTLHVELYRLATSFAGQMGTPTDLSGIQLLVDLCWYAIYAGNVHTIFVYFLPMISAAHDIGLLDESTSLWEHTTADGRNEMRTLAEAVITVQRWSSLAQHRIGMVPTFPSNTCRPTHRSEPLVKPISLHRQEDAFSDTTFRILRLRGSAESRLSTSYRALSFDITGFFDRIAPSTVNGQDVSFFAEKARATLDDLMRWREQRVIPSGFGLISLDSFDPDDLLACQNLDQSVYLHHAYYCVVGILLRPWLSERKLNPSATESYLQQACLDNAEAVKNTIPHIKALVASRRAPIILPWLASNLFYAAITFASPVIRAVTNTTAFEKDEAVRRLLSIPDSFYKDPWTDQVTSTLGAVDAQPVPIEVFNNVDIWRCATSMLTILDGMSVLNSSPFSSQAKTRLEELIQQTGLRETEAILSRNTDAVAPPVISQGLPECTVSWGEPVSDATLFEQLLQMDPAIWEQLAAFTGPTDASA